MADQSPRLRPKQPSDAAAPPAPAAPPPQPTPKKAIPHPFASFVGSRAVVTTGGAVIEGDVVELRDGIMTLHDCAIFGTQHVAVGIARVAITVKQNVVHVNTVPASVTSTRAVADRAELNDTLARAKEILSDGPVNLTDAAAVKQIADLMDRVHWTSATLDAIANVVRRAGRLVRNPA